MRRALGWLVFLGGVFALGYWAQGNQARSIESGIRAEAAAIDLGVHDKVIVRVSGRDILLSGDIPNDEARELVLIQMSEVDGHRIVHDSMNVTAQN